MLQDESLNVRGSFDAEISGLECTVSEPPLPSACSSPMRMQESPFPTSSSSQESLVNLIQPVGRHKQVKRKQDLSSGLLAYLEKSEDREERLQEQGQAMLKEVHGANSEFLRVFTRIELNSHSMLGSGHSVRLELDNIMKESSFKERRCVTICLLLLTAFLIFFQFQPKMSSTIIYPKATTEPPKVRSICNFPPLSPKDALEERLLLESLLGLKLLHCHLLFPWS
ncbi:hypothetical protein JOQ06_017534 [Pogonophryne albipinna]|uniref:Uncharacterized protein n=1 Tax=Pogonophryne albipinna TaxID=1090488 RepID=A0AAD6B1D0_9TELE|nr:hypothetical protein JOQ06_017534 [Pogonophryne albipinna]